jgi:hypothetical protein
MSNTAADIADLLDNSGLNWETADGRKFAEIVKERGGRAEYAQTHTSDDGDIEYSEVSRGAVHDVARYVFPDGSAIVESGPCWDLEKPGQPFRMLGA